MRGSTVRRMDALYRVCVVVAGGALVLISAVIPWGVFTRYVLNSAASWPEPMAILLTIVLTFFGAAACYRAGTHMSVSVAVAGAVAAIAAGHRAVRRGVGRAGQPFHGHLGRAAGRRDLAPVDRRVSGVVCRSDLSADPGWRRHYFAVRRRAPADRSPAAGRRTGAALTRSAAMEILIVVGTLLVCFALGVPIAYALGSGLSPAPTGSASRSRR